MDSLGWKSCRFRKENGGDWSYAEKNNHINYLEFKAVFLTLKTFCSTTSNTHTQIRVDNMIAMHYINKTGGRILNLNQLAQGIWFWCIARNIWLSACHIPGVETTEADRLLRTINADLEWKLEETTFKKISKFFKLSNSVDLFASRINHQLERYVSYFPDPDAICVDDFSFSLKNIFFKIYYFHLSV